MREADSLYSSLKMLRDTGDVEGGKALRKGAGKKGEPLLQQRQRLNRLCKQLFGFNRQIDAVYHDRSLNGSQKRAKIDGIRMRKNVLAKAEWGKIRRELKRYQ